MTRTLRRAGHIPPIGHAEAMRLAEAENARLLAQLRGLTAEQWQAPTDCTGWTVRDVVVHLIASAQAQASVLEFGRQVVAGRRLAAQACGRHWVDGLNEAQLRGRAGWTTTTLPDRWERHCARALTARRRMPAPVRALPVLPLALQGPAGGDFTAGGGSTAGGDFTAGDSGDAQAVDAVEFVRILSGRAEGTGVLRHKLPL